MVSHHINFTEPAQTPVDRLNGKPFALQHGLRDVFALLPGFPGLSAHWSSYVALDTDTPMEDRILTERKGLTEGFEGRFNVFPDDLPNRFNLGLNRIPLGINPTKLKFKRLIDSLDSRNTSL